MFACKQKEACMRISSKTSRQAFWQEVLQRQRRSGLSIQQFCRQEGLAAPTFYVWKRRLGPGVAAENPSIGFTPVRVQPDAASSVSAGSIDIFLPQDRRIRLTGPVDRQQLTTVLAALAG
jgi:transposase-like protein